MNSATHSLLAAWNRLSGRERLFAGLCALVLGIALAYQGLVLPYLNYSEELQTQIESKRLKLAKYQRWLRASQAHSPKEIPVIPVAGDENEDMSQFLNRIQLLASQSGTRILDLKPVRGRKQGIQEKLGLDLQLDCHMPSLAGFLYRLQSSDQLFEVNRFQVSAGEGPSLRASLVITQTLFLAEPNRASAQNQRRNQP